MPITVNKIFRWVGRSQSSITILIAIGSLLTSFVWHIYTMDRDIVILQTNQVELSRGLEDLKDSVSKNTISQSDSVARLQDQTNQRLDNIDDQVDKLNTFITEYFANRSRRNS